MELMTSGTAISLDDSAVQYEGIGIHCVRFKQWIIYAWLRANIGFCKAADDSKKGLNGREGG